MDHTRKQRLLMLLLPLVALAPGCIFIEDRAMVVEEHWTVEMDGRKMPLKDVRTESSRQPDGTLTVKQDVKLHQEGTKALREYFREAANNAEAEGQDATRALSPQGGENRGRDSEGK